MNPEQRVRFPHIFAVFVLLFGVIAALASPGIARAQDSEIDQQQFSDLVDTATSTDPLFGPEDGDLKHDPEIITLADANLDLADALIEVTFANPAAASRHNFDYGIQFRRTFNGIDNKYLTFIIVDTGQWALMDADQNVILTDTYADFNDRRDAENTLTIYALGSTIHLGINGDYVGSADVPLVKAGDVLVGTAFFTDSYIRNGVTPYTNFTVWSLAGTDNSDVDSGRTGDLGQVNDSKNDQSDTGDRSSSIETPTSEATATDIPQPTDTPEPTDTPKPTSTPEPTGTAVPTATPAPTETTVPTATDEPTQAPTATVPAVASPVASPAASPVVDASGVSRYTEPTYGYSLSFDSTWKVVQDSSADGNPVLTLTNGISNLAFTAAAVAEGEPIGSALDDAIASLASTPGLDGVEILKDANGVDIRSDGVINAAALLRAIVTDKDGNEAEFRYYVETRVISNQSAVLIIIHSAPVDSYVDQISDRIKVTTTISFATR